MRAVTAGIQLYCHRAGGKRLFHSLVTFGTVGPSSAELVAEHPHPTPLFSRQQAEERADWRDEGGKTGSCSSFSALASK